MTRLALAFGFIGMIAGSASAQEVVASSACVALDETRDTLPPEDRRAAMISFQQALVKNHVNVVEGGCTVTYTIYNVKLGNAITVYVVGPSGTQQLRASKIDELPQVYEQLAHAIVTGQPLGSDQNADRTNVTDAQTAPKRIASDNLKFVTIGYGLETGPGTAGGPAIGYGWRFELDRLAVEISGDIAIVSSTDSMGNSHGGVSGNLIKLAGYYYQNPISNASLYYGLGLGYGVAFLCDNNVNTGGNCYAGGGLEASPTVGYEMLRSSTIRFLVQLTAGLPLYTANALLTDGTTDKRWIPTFALSVGIGFGRSNTIRVVSN
jgi:hypothetical protein